jgi:hypothetical protein
LLIISPLKNLWGCKVSSACACSKRLAQLETPCHPKVCDPKSTLFKRAACRQKKVLRLQIAVADLVDVHVKDRTEQLWHDGSYLWLRKMTGVLYLCIQIATMAQFHDQAYALVTFK